MKKLFTLLFTLLSTTVLWAYDFEVNGIYYSISEHNAKEVSVTYKSWNNPTYSGSVLIPSTVTYNKTTYSVTSIGEYAFYNCSSLTSVSIPNSVTSIGWSAFDGCSSLASITIPNSVTSIGWGAFSGCSGLTSPVYNAHCFAYMPTSYEGAYIIPNGIKQIAGSAFSGCSSLTSITIPNSVTSIGEWAFARCSGLTSITIPNSVKRIGSDAFYGCSGLTSITIPNSVTEIGYSAFGGIRPNISCGPVYMDNCLVDIRYTDCEVCYENLPDVFVVQPGTRLIADVMFCGYAPHTIVIPSSVKYMDYRVFACGECNPIRNIFCSAATPPIFANIETDCYNLEDFPIAAYVPMQSLHLYQEAEGWKEFKLVPYHYDKPKESTEIFNYQHINSADLELVSYKAKCPKQVEVPGFATLNDSIYTVTSIAQHAFKNQKSLRSIAIPYTVHHIGKEAFYGTGIYTNQKNWQEGVLYVDKCLIKANSEISGEHIVPAGTHVIAEEAFDGCIWLGGVVLPESLTHINSAAFRGCKWLVKITSHSYTPPVLADDVFEHVDVSLTKVYVPSYALDDYKQADGWKMFKHILPIPDDDSL